MADTERYLLYMGTGFLGMLFLMSKFSILRPKRAVVRAAQYQYPIVYPREWIGERPS